MNWDELLNVLEQNIHNAKHRHVSPSGWETMGYDQYFLDLYIEDKYFEIRYDPNETKNYFNTSACWIWIEMYERKKRTIFTRLRRVAFFRPSYHSEDGAIIIPKEYSNRIKKLVRDYILRREQNRLNSIHV